MPREPLYLGIFADDDRWTGETGKGLIAAEFETELADDIRIIAAAYTDENYSGDAFVLYAQNGAYYEVNGSHCSCYGLEGQWEPEEASLTELARRPRYISYEYLPYNHDIDAQIRARIEQELEFCQSFKGDTKARED